ncbi:helix-turn-helix domain-containing protein [Actinacidiphila sp. bgisy145]|uniref:helix-turn-helix domain-containing protein n=1 Tax=Actinacidiphila sp. bgisy145 TaxID=3413792 RepID=UPI003EB69F8E
MRPNGIAIRTIRKAQNLTLRGLARQARCHPSHLSRLERGLAGASDETIQRLADGLMVPVGAIATLTEETL